MRKKDNMTPFDVANKVGKYEIATYILEKKREALNQKSSNVIDDKALCIICLEPRNGFYVLVPCGHASLCEPCCIKLTCKTEKSKCPSCRSQIKSYNKIFFQMPV